MRVWAESSLPKPGFHFRVTDEREKEPFLELDLLTLRPLWLLLYPAGMKELSKQRFAVSDSTCMRAKTLRQQ